MKNFIFASLTILLAVCFQVQAQTLEKLWEATGLDNPESVIYDAKQKTFYVSNVVGSPTDKDGNGYLSKLDENGKIAKVFDKVDVSAHADEVLEAFGEK